MRPRPEPPQRANRHAWRTRPELAWARVPSQLRPSAAARSGRNAKGGKEKTVVLLYKTGSLHRNLPGNRKGERGKEKTVLLFWYKTGSVGLQRNLPGIREGGKEKTVLFFVQNRQNAWRTRPELPQRTNCHA